MVQRVEVITSVERRRRYSDDEKRRVVEETMQPGSSVMATARRRGISPSLIFAWRKALRVAPAAAVSSTMTEAAVGQSACSDLFGRVKAEVAALRARSPGERRHCPASIRALVLEALDDGFTIRKVAAETGLPPGTIARWKSQAKPAAALAVRELKIIGRPAAEPAVVPEGKLLKSACIKVGVATIEIPVDALSADLLRALVAAGGGR